MRLIAALLLLSLLSMAAQGGGVLGIGKSGNGGGGHVYVGFDGVFTAIQDGKQRDPQKFDMLKKLLYMEPPISKDYDKNLSLGIEASRKGNLTRNDDLMVTTTVVNPNPIESRRDLYIYLDILEPGDRSFHRADFAPIIIPNDGYIEDDGRNISIRTFPEPVSFGHLKAVGPVIFRLDVRDGQYRWTSDNYTLNMINCPPSMGNLTIQGSDHPRFNDPILYLARVTDLDGDRINITLHILDEQGITELKNRTQEIKGNDVVSFKASEYGLFSELDAGKSFSYYYSFDDGINSSRTEICKGPSIRRGPSLFIDKIDFEPESESCYWWQWYTFNVRAKNLNPEEFDVVFALYTNTRSNPWTEVDRKTVRIGPEPQVVYFNRTHPFFVTDSNGSFSYRITFSEYDQNGNDKAESAGGRISPKIVPYAIYHPVMIFNLALMAVSIVVGSLFIERMLKRGIESQESSSARSEMRWGKRRG